MLKKINLLLVILIFSCKQEKRYHDIDKGDLSGTSLAIKENLLFREELNKSFKNPELSPLPDRYRKDFQELDFFPIDTTYIVHAFLERRPDSKPFLMATNTERKSRERIYGIAYFELNGKKEKLEVYQTLGAVKTKHLFLPFLDQTNGNETYGGGRYLDLKIPGGDTLLIDFNKAYNPYCVYNKKYSCPLVPLQNHLNSSVTAGIKMFRKK